MKKLDMEGSGPYIIVININTSNVEVDIAYVGEIMRMDTIHNAQYVYYYDKETGQDELWEDFPYEHIKVELLTDVLLDIVISLQSI